MIIKTANVNDIKRIADIKVRGWQQTHADIVDSNYLSNMTFDDQFYNYSNHYDLNNIIVAESDGIVVGFCRYFFIDSLNTDCEIREIYVEPNLKRTGIGSMLFN